MKPFGSAQGKLLQPVAVKKLLGIRNTMRPERQPWGACADAVNLVVDDSYTLERREGYRLALEITTGASDLFGARQHDGLFGIVNGQLVSFGDDLNPAALADVLQGEVAWAELGNRVFYAGHEAAGMVANRQNWQPLRIPVPEFSAEAMAGGHPAGQYQITATYTHTASGLEGPAAPVQVLNLAEGKSLAVSVAPLDGHTANVYISDPDGSLPYLSDVIPLAHEQRDAQPFPREVTALAATGGVLYAAVYDEANDVGFVHWSQPFWFTCWRLATDYVSMPGRVLGMASTGPGLVILTTHTCWLWNGEILVHLADYGGIPGRCIAHDHWGRAWFWTKRGVCTLSAEEGWKNLTEERVSVAPGTWCSTAVIERRGGSYFVAVTDGVGKAANPYATPHLGGRCWAVNLKNGEMTRFENFGFLAFGELRGEVYGLKTYGLYSIGADADDSTGWDDPAPIQASFTLHPTDFGDSSLKRCTYAYVTGCDAVTLTVTAVCDSQWVGDYAARRRIPLSRGVKGQFWQFRVADPYDGPMRLTGFEILVEPTRRRV